METEIDDPPSSLLLAELFTDTALFYTAGGLVLVLLLIATRLSKFLGVTGVHVVNRVMGILLCALAVQFIFDGIKEGFKF